MRFKLLTLATAWAALALTMASPAVAQQADNYDYWRFNREMIRYGQQAVFMCNGLFTSNRTLEQVFEQELAFLPQPVGTARGGDYTVDHDRQAVTIGAPGGTPQMRAAFREGIGCIILPPDQTLEEIGQLPILDMAPPAGDPATIPWPDGDLLADSASSGVTRYTMNSAPPWLM